MIMKMNVGTNFKVKLTILIFWTRFIQIVYFWSKTEKVKTTI